MSKNRKMKEKKKQQQQQQQQQQQKLIKEPLLTLLYMENMWSILNF